MVFGDDQVLPPSGERTKSKPTANADVRSAASQNCRQTAIAQFDQHREIACTFDNEPTLPFPQQSLLHSLHFPLLSLPYAVFSPLVG